MSLPEEKAYVFEMEASKEMIKLDARSFVESRFEENVPLKLTEAIFDYQVFKLDQSKVRIMVVAYHKEVIDQYYSLFDMSGLIPVAFEVESEALSRSVIQTDNPAVHMLIDLGETQTRVSVVQHGALLFNSTVEYGGKDIDKALQSIYQTDLSDEELRRYKSQEGIVGGASDKRTAEAIVPTIAALKEKIDSLIQYWHTSETSKYKRRIQSIVLCGGGANIRGVSEYFSNSFHMPVETANVWTNVLDLSETIPQIKRSDSYSYATAIGLALNQKLDVL